MPSNKEIFNRNQKTDNILKFQWEINILANETNRNYSQMILNFIVSAISLIFIVICVSQNFDQNIISIFLLSSAFTIIIYVNQNIKKTIEKRILDQVDKNFILINELSINEIENNNYSEKDGKYKTFIKNNLKNIKNVFIKIFIKKTLFDTISSILKILYISFIGYFALKYINYNSLNLDEFIISFAFTEIHFNYFYNKSKLIYNILR
jgi:hypothetical protein